MSDLAFALAEIPNRDRVEAAQRAMAWAEAWLRGDVYNPELMAVIDALELVEVVTASQE